MEQEFVNKVFDHLDKLPFGVEYPVERVSPENRLKFIETVKLHINTDSGGPEYLMEFTNDYSAIRKLKK